MMIIAQFGSTEGIRFDHYVTDWDFDDYSMKKNSEK